MARVLFPCRIHSLVARALACSAGTRAGVRGDFLRSLCVPRSHLCKLLEMLDEFDIKVRVAEAAAALLGMDKDPEDWRAADYKSAIIHKFNL